MKTIGIYFGDLIAAIFYLLLIAHYQLDGLLIWFHESDTHRSEAIAAVQADYDLLAQYEYQVFHLYEEQNFRGLIDAITALQTRYEQGESPVLLANEMNVFRYREGGEEN